MENTIHVNEILPKKITRITTGSELLLIFEINKYTELLLNARTITDGIEVHDILKGCEHYSFVMTNGFNFGIDLTEEERDNLKSYDSTLYFKANVLTAYGNTGVVLKSKTDTEWVYERYYAMVENNFMARAYKSHAYVSLLAYMLVVSFRDNISPVLIIDHENNSDTEFEYADLIILKDWGNKPIEGRVDIRFSATRELQPTWEAFLKLNQQRGFMVREYNKAEKFKYLNKFFEIGDVVLLYKRDLTARGKVLGRLVSCYPAVIEKFDKDTVTLKYYPIPRTTTTHHLEVEFIKDLCEDEDKNYSPQDYNTFPISKMQQDLNDIGVDKFTYREKFFFIKPVDSDGSYQYFRTETGYKKVQLGTLDTIYAVFEDRGVEYNKDKFLETYFTSKNRVPVYEQYRETE
jgi:hypothetical protein